MTATQILNLQAHLKATLIQSNSDYWVLIYLQKQELELLPLHIITDKKGEGSHGPLILSLSRFKNSKKDKPDQTVLLLLTSTTQLFLNRDMGLMTLQSKGEVAETNLVTKYSLQKSLTYHLSKNCLKSKAVIS